MGILKDLIERIDLLPAIGYTDQRSDGDTESCKDGDAGS